MEKEADGSPCYCCAPRLCSSVPLLQAEGERARERERERARETQTQLAVSSQSARTRHTNPYACFKMRFGFFMANVADSVADTKQLLVAWTSVSTHRARMYSSSCLGSPWKHSDG